MLTTTAHMSHHLSDRAVADYELVCRALQHNDQRAYAELMERYYGSLHCTMLRMVQQPEDADDLTIEAFGKAFRQLEHYAPHYAFSTWLFKIATNNSLDYLRRQRAQELSLELALAEENAATETAAFLHRLSDDALDPEEQFIVAQRHHLMRELLQQLSERYRQVIELRFFEELSYEEVAERLQLPIGTIKSNIHRAKELLYDVLNRTR